MKGFFKKLYHGMYIQEALGIMPRKWKLVVSVIQTLNENGFLIRYLREIYIWDRRKWKCELWVESGKVTQFWVIDKKSK